MGLKTATGEVLPARQRSVINLGRSATANEVEMKGQSLESIPSVGDMPLQSR